MIKKQRSEEMEDGEEEEEGHWEDWEIAGKSATAYQSSARDGGGVVNFRYKQCIPRCPGWGGGAMEIAGSEQVYPLACG